MGDWVTPLSCSVDDPELPASMLSAVGAILASLDCLGLRPLFAVPSAWNAPTPAPATCTALSLTPSGLYSDITSRDPHISAALSRHSPFLALHSFLHSTL